MTTTSKWPSSLLASYAGRLVDAGPGRLEAVALQMGDSSVRQLLAQLASDGRASYAELAESFLTTGAPPPAVQPAPNRMCWMASLARVVALQHIHGSDIDLGLSIYRHLHACDHVATYGGVHAKLFADLLLTVGADREVQSLLATNALSGIDEQLLTADLRNPWRNGPLATDPASWARDFETAGHFCVDPPLAIGNGEAPFDRLRTKSEQAAISDALVSVIFPVHKPGESLRHAVSSISCQTWTDLEVIIVDDGSGPDYTDLLEDVARTDPRIRLVRRDQNRGAYAARNLGLSLARGCLVAFHDHDDWSHPRRIELQAGPLLADRAVMATHSRCARVSEALVFAHPGYHPIRHNASSLMIRRHEVVLGVGYFDEVRKSGDSEYHARIIAHFGRPAVENLRTEPVLAAVRRLDRSLSRSDFRAGWHHPDRVWYRDSYRHWHRRSGRPNLFLDAGPLRRPFPAPRSFEPGRPPAPTLDLIVLADWHVGGESTVGLLDWCKRQHEQGRRVGVAHLNSLAHTTTLRPPLVPEVVDLVHAGQVHYVDAHEPAKAQRMVVAHPSVLQFAADLSIAWTVEKVVLLEDVEKPVSSSPIGAFDAEYAGHLVRTAFGCEPEWTSFRGVIALGAQHP